MKPEQQEQERRRREEAERKRRIDRAVDVYKKHRDNLPPDPRRGGNRPDVR